MWPRKSYHNGLWASDSLKAYLESNPTCDTGVNHFSLSNSDPRAYHVSRLTELSAESAKGNTFL